MSARASHVALRAEGLERHFGGLRAVDGVSFSVEQGQMVGIIGPNGAGKSTLFDLVAGAQRPTQGRVFLGGGDVTDLPTYKRARLGLVRTFQHPRPISRLSVLENLMLAARQHPGERFWKPLLAPDPVRRREADVREEAFRALVFLELVEHADDYAGALSGGQKKLLDLARALMADPHTLLLDEPMAGVNPTLARKLMDKIETLRREKGLTFLLVEHDLETVYARCDPIIVMANGKIIAQGSAEQIREDRAVMDAYLGGGR